jgi:alpha-beta hydrolase superfamily lysophospholipase
MWYRNLFSAACCGVSLALAACAVTQAPLGNQTTTPQVTGDFFETRDGLKLPLRHWDAEGLPRAIVLALHGMSDYSNAFDSPAKQWAASGITTLAFDQRGFGAGPNPGLWAGGEVMRADLFDFAAVAKTRYPGIPIFALGESMGGAVLLSALATSDAPQLAGVILVAPAVWARRDMPLTYRAALFLAAHLVPGMILSNNAASHVVTIVPSDNVAMLRALSRDPLFQKETRADTVFGLVNLMDEARDAPKKITGAPPILLLSGLKDQIIPRGATEGVIADLDGRAAVRRYDQGYHMLLRDLEGPAVNKDVADWILRQVPETQRK